MKILFSNGTASNDTGPAVTSTTAAGPVDEYAMVKVVLHVIDRVTVVYFFLEYALRLLCSPRKLKFFLQPMNFIDFLAILPYVVSLMISSLQDLHILGKAGKIMRLVRVMRILR